MLNIHEEISGPAKILMMRTRRGLRGDTFSAPRRILKSGFAYLLVFMATYGVFKLCRQFIVQSVQVDGRSMLPTLLDSQRYLLNRFVYLVRAPKLKEIVGLRDPETGGYAVKRIIAQPGDRVYVNDGQLFVNGKLLREPYLERGTKTYAGPHYRAQMWVCGLNQYFVLGDNRNNSADSRVYGAVPRQNILGLVTP